MSKKKAILLLCVILIAASGVRIQFLETGAKPEARNPTDQGTHHDYRGPIHWHSEYTRNCTGTYEEIAEVANRQKVDFMIATERNTLQALDDGKEGWYGSTLMLSSAEVSRYNEWSNNTYFLALGLKKFQREKTDTEDAMLTDFASQGALVFRAHPNNPRWSWGGRPVDDRVVGQEIMDMTDEFNMADPATLATSLYYYIFNRRVAWARLFDRPDETLRDWDEITHRRPFVGIYAPDFHQAVILGDYKWKYPKVEEVLGVAHNHILLPEAFTGDLQKDKAAVYDALRKGHVYVAVDLIQDPTGFTFTAKRGDETFWMGDTMPAGCGAAPPATAATDELDPPHALLQTVAQQDAAPGVACEKKPTLHVKLPPLGNLKNPIIHLYQNGAEIARGEADAWSYHPLKGGAYRAEVSVEVPAFWGGGRRMGWIYSNPIYIAD